jgi:hypothetical protein
MQQPKVSEVSKCRMTEAEKRRWRMGMEKLVVCGCDLPAAKTGRRWRATGRLWGLGIAGALPITCSDLCLTFSTAARSDFDFVKKDDMHKP